MLICLAVLQLGWIGDWSRHMKRGQTLYESENYEAARSAYESAVRERPDHPHAHYNLGTAFYKTGQYKEAADAFRRALTTEDTSLQAQAYYNLGNTQLKLNALEDAILAYKNALRLNPELQHAKHNLELALEKLQQQAQQDGSGQNSQEQQEQEQNNQQQNEQQSNENQQQPEAEQSQQQDETQSDEQVSREDAIRLLDALKDDEKEIQKKVLRQRFARGQRPEKDW